MEDAVVLVVGLVAPGRDHNPRRRSIGGPYSGKGRGGRLVIAGRIAGVWRLAPHPNQATGGLDRSSDNCRAGALLIADYWQC